jgi:Holliday junction resolvase
MSTATKGRAFEHEVIHLFKDAGFSVIRGASSKGEFYGEKVDLVATRTTAQNEYKAFVNVYPDQQAVAVQCKVRGKK